MKLSNERNLQFIKILNDKGRIIFFTAENDGDFYILSKSFQQNINNVKSLFNLKDFRLFKANS